MKYCLIFWSETQQEADFNYLLKLFSQNRDRCELVHECRWSMLLSYSDGCLDEMASNKELDAFVYDSLEELLKEQEADSLEELKGDLEHSDALIDAHRGADDDEFKANLANL